MNEPPSDLLAPRFRWLTPLEKVELLSGVRSLPARLAGGALTTLLLYLCGDMVGWWPLCWFAFVPLAFACRGAGAPAALLVAFPVLLGANLAQCHWLLDTPEPAWGLWLMAALFPALAFFTVELPFCISRLPWVVRPLILGFALIGAYAMLPPEAGPLVPLGGLIDSEFTRFAYAKLGLATFAGIFGALAWLAAELHTRKGEGERTLHGWPGMLVVGLLVLAGCIDGLGVKLAPKREYAGDQTRVFLVPARPDAVAATEKLMGPRARGGVVLWGAMPARAESEAESILHDAGALSEQRGCTIALVIARPTFSTGHIFIKAATPAMSKRWEGPPGQSQGDPLVMEGPGVLTLHPRLAPPQVGTARHDLQLCTTPDKPVHQAQAAWWLREQRRGALVRQARQLCVWDGGGAVIAHDGHLVAASGSEGVSATLTPSVDLGEAMGKPRLMVLEKILRFAAPTGTVTLMVLSIVAWAKRRWRQRRDQTGEIAIEEVYDGQ